MPIARVQMPDGRIARLDVPDGTTPEQVVEFVQQMGPQPSAESSVQADEPSTAAKIVRGGSELGQGFTDSLAETVGSIPDAVAAGLRYVGADAFAPQDPDYYAKVLKSGARRIEDLISRPLRGVTPDTSGPRTETEKTLYAAGHGGGDAVSVFAPAAAVSKIAKAGSVAQKAANALKAQPVAQMVAGATGAGVGEATDNPYLGFAASLAVPTVAGAGRNAAIDALSRRATVKAAPGTRALAGEGSNLFTDALNNPAMVSIQAYDNLLGAMGQKLADEGAAPLLHPKVTAVFNELSKRSGSAPTLRDLQTARRQIGIAASSNEPDERRIAMNMRDQLDDFVENLTPGDMASGQVGSSVTDLRVARGLWRRMSKSQLIEDAIEAAQLQASGVENGLRTQFRQLRKNKKAMRGFSADEKAAIQDVAEGRFTRNSLRRIGRLLSPGSGVQTNNLSALFGIGAGATLGGPLGAVAAPIVGYASQKAAEAGTQNAADYARALVALGGKASPGRTEQLLGRANTPGLYASTALGQANTPAGEQLLQGLLEQ